MFEFQRPGTSVGGRSILSSNSDAHKIAFRLDIMLSFVIVKLHRENLQDSPRQDPPVHVTRRQVTQTYLVVSRVSHVPYSRGSRPC